MLQRVSADELHLGKDITEFDIDVDSWVTNVEGVSCYGVNVLEPQGGRVGIFYIEIHGNVIYRLSEDEIFIEVAQ